MTEHVAEGRAAHDLHDDDIIGVLLRQHERIESLFEEMREADGEHRQHVFDELRALLAVHETGEEMVLRPVTKQTAGDKVAQARNNEEDQANHTLADLERMDVNGQDFASHFAEFRQSVLDHASKEESEEFPAILREQPEEKRRKMGARLRTVERFAPTHPHPAAAGSPAAQWTAGPFAAVADRVKDALRS